MSNGDGTKKSPFDDAPSAVVYGFFFAAGAYLFGLGKSLLSSDGDGDDELEEGDDDA